MADPNAPRTFPNDPNPPPVPPVSRPGPPAGGPEPGEGGAGDIAIELGSAPIAKERTAFRVVQGDDGREVFALTPDFESTRLGRVNIPEADEILNRAGVFNEATRSWDVPENVARALMGGRLSTPEFLKAKWRASEANVARGLLGKKWLLGEIDRDEALARGNRELMKVQLGEQPEAVWNAGFGKMIGDAMDDPIGSAQGTARFAAGEAAALGPFLLGASGEAAKGAVILGAGGAALTAAALGTGGLATPASIAGIAGLMKTGAAYGVFRYTMDVEGGGLTVDMLGQGFEDETIKQVAPAAGAVSGALEIVGFKYLTAPMKRIFVRKVLAAPAVRGAMAKWYVNYAKELGAEVAVEVAQERVNQLANNFAASVDERPDLLLDWDKSKEQLWDTAIRATAGLAVIKGPSAVLEGGVQFVQSKEEAATEAAMTERVEQRAEAAALAQAKKIPAAEVLAPTPEAADAAAKATAPEGKPVEPPTTEQVESLVQEFEAGAVTEEQVIAGAEAIFETKIERETETQRKTRADVAKARPPFPLEKKTRVVESKARVRALEADLAETSTLVNELIAARQALQNRGVPTRRLDKQIDPLLVEEKAIQEELEFFKQTPAEETLVTPEARLDLKPATLENIIAEGFKEGRKDVIKTRAAEIKRIASEHGLTQGDIKKLLKDKNFGLMGDVEFRNFMTKGRERTNKKGEKVRTPSFVDQVKALVEWKNALKVVKMVQKDRQIKREVNVRKLHDLPPVQKMTTEQLKKYAVILSKYERGDEPLTAKRVKALETTPLRGVKTMREVLKKAAALLDVPLKDLQAQDISEFDLFRFDTALAGRTPMLRFMVEHTKENELIAGTEFFELRRKMMELANKAVASRPRGILRRLVPTMPEVMAYMEADGPDAKVAAAAVLTKEELALAEFLEAAYERAYDYLIQTGDLQKSRFAGGKFVHHTKRPISELIADIPNIGLKAAVKEFLSRWKADETRFEVVDRQGRALGLRKFFKATLFRSGQITPTRNVIQASDIYFQQFYKKKALDASIPAIETLTKALRSQSQDQGKDAKALWDAFDSFVKSYLNAKKGQAAITGIKQGGKIDAGIRFVSDIVSLKFIAANYALQVAAIVGETAAKVPLLGLRALARAQARKLTAKGQQILEENRAFTGEPLRRQIFEPGRTLEAQFGTFLFGLFQANRVNTMEDLILGSMTAQEWEAGAISKKRLAQIKIQAGRWLDMPGAKSALGSTSTGAALTKFRGWAIPIMRTTLEDVNALRKFILSGGKERLTAQQFAELYRIVEITAIAALVARYVDIDEDDDSFLGKAKRYAIRELTTLSQALKPTTVLTAGVVVAFLEQLAKDIELLLTMEEFKKKDGLKGVSALQRHLTPAAVRQFQRKDED